MKLVSWNVNGFRAALGKGFQESFESLNADIFCIQETKMQPEQVTTSFTGYHQYFNSAIKKGYSGTAVFTREEPSSITFNFASHTDEGRTIVCEYEKFYLVNVYVPNSQDKLARIDYRMQWEDDLRGYLRELEENKPIILCGDLNVAHTEIDLKNPKSNVGKAGFSQQERDKFGMLLDSGYTDTFRYLYPDVRDAYSWWSYRMRARERNAGWRIDYFLVSNSLQSQIQHASIHADIMGSDHCPVSLEITL